MNAVCVDYETIYADNTVDVNKRQQITLSTTIEVAVDTIDHTKPPTVPFDKVLYRKGRSEL